MSKDEFAAFIKKAAQKGTSEYDELYFFLLSCFQAGDAHKVISDPFYNTMPPLLLISNNLILLPDIFEIRRLST